MPWIVVAAPIRPMQMTPTVNEWVATNPAVARVSSSPAHSAMRASPSSRARIATARPPARAASPMVLARIASPSAPRENSCATNGGSISGTERSSNPSDAANRKIGPIPPLRAT